MCYAGGPRCTTDTARALDTARTRFAAAVQGADQSPGGRRARERLDRASEGLVRAQLRFDSSPGGLEALGVAVGDRASDPALRARLAGGFATRLAEWRGHDEREGRAPRDFVPMPVAGREHVRVVGLHALPVERAGELAAVDARDQAVADRAALALGLEPEPIARRATPVLAELHPDEAGLFRERISALREDSRYAASVYVYDEDEYRDMRMFLTADGSAGVAVKADGDVVSVFSTGAQPRVANALLATAVANGGTKLDCFDTVLPRLYAQEGFTETGRMTWDDQYRPDGWNEADYASYNQGRPDVVLMTYDHEKRAR